MNPRTLATDDGYVATDVVFLCAGCQRRLLWVGFRDFLTQQPHVIVFPVLPVVLSLLVYGWSSKLILNEKVLSGLAVGAFGCALLVLRWFRRDSPTMQRLCFELRRHDLAEHLSLPASQLGQYPAR